MLKAKRNPAKNRILKVTIKRMVDDSPDTSWLGEYSNHATSDFSIDRAHAEDCDSLIPDTDERPDLPHDEDCTYRLSNGVAECSCEKDCIPHCCDCGERGDMGRNEYRYFNPSFNYVDKNGKATDTPENVREYARRDYERMERLNAGDGCFIGIRAEAECRFPYMTEGRGGRTYFNTQILTSGGLWGIESDSGHAYLESVEQDELADLKAQLLALGFSKRAVCAAFRKAITEDKT